MKKISVAILIDKENDISCYRFKCAIAPKSNYYKARNLFCKRKYYAYYLEKAEIPYYLKDNFVFVKGFGEVTKENLPIFNCNYM